MNNQVCMTRNSGYCETLYPLEAMHIGQNKINSNECFVTGNS